MKKQQFEIPGREGKFVAGTTIHEKYQNRPDALEKNCLAQFAISYESSGKPAKIVIRNGISDDDGFLKLFETKIKIILIGCLLNVL